MRLNCFSHRMVSSTSTLALIPLFIQILTGSKGMDVGVHELRSVGTSVMRRTLSDWPQTTNDVPRPQDETILDFLKDSPWAFFSLRGGETGNSRNNVNYRPRLGRDEEMVFTETSRSPPFAPRLGRVVPYSPRYGRISMNSN